MKSKIRVLFVGKANINRSQIAATALLRLIQDIEGLDSERITIGSAGTDTYDYGYTPQELRQNLHVCQITQVSASMCRRADIIFALDYYVRIKLIEDYYAEPGKVISLNVFGGYLNRQDHRDKLRDKLETDLRFYLPMLVDMLEQKDDARTQAIAGTTQ